MRAVKLSLFFVIYFLISVISSYASEESLAITTYYPSPYGSYRELRSQMMAIGTNYYSASYTCWPGGSCTYPIPAAASLVVEGNVGIGTTAPGQALDVNGNIRSRGGNWQSYTGAAYVAAYYDALTHRFDISGSPKMSIDTSGNVGIGTTAPTEKLHVSNGYIRGQLKCRTVTAEGGPPNYLSTATCNSNEWLLAGGGQCTDVSNNHVMHASFPSGNSWFVDCYNNTYTGEASSRAYAICCEK